MLTLLLLLLFPISIDSCLKIRFSVTTTTPKPNCYCGYRDFDKNDLEGVKRYLYMEFYLRNLTYYPVIKPTSSRSTDGCDLTVSCPTGYTLMIGALMPYSEAFSVHQYGTGLETQCDPYSQTWFIDDGVQEVRRTTELRGFCVDYTDHSTVPTTPTPNPIDMGSCTCPPIGFIDQAGIQKLSWANGGFLGSLETVKPEVQVNSNNCSVVFSCNALNGSYHNMVLFQEDKPPLYITVTSFDNKTRPPTHIKGLSCDGGTWKYFGAKLSKFYLACQKYPGSCNCPAIGNSSALGYFHTSIRVFKQVLTCGLKQFICPKNTTAGIVSSNKLPFLFGVDSGTITTNLFCFPDESGKLSWYLQNFKLDNLAVSCSSAVLKEDCKCYPINVISSSNRATFDPKGYLPSNLANVFVFYNQPGETGCDAATVTCYNGQKPLLFAANWDVPVLLNEPLYCGQDLASIGAGDESFSSLNWITSTYGLITNPSVACPNDQPHCSCGGPGGIEVKTPNNLKEQSPDPACQKVITCDPLYSDFRIYEDPNTLPTVTKSLKNGEPLVMTCGSSGKWEVEGVLYDIKQIQCAPPPGWVPPPPPPTA